MASDKATARRKGFLAGGVAGGSILLMTLSPALGIIGLVGAGYLAYDWFMYRAKRGMRF